MVKLASLRKNLPPRRLRARKAQSSQPSWGTREKQRFSDVAERSLRGASAAFAGPPAIVL
jgi:hypothetical protein